MTKKIVFTRICFAALMCAMLLSSARCGKIDVTGEWKLTLNWDSRASHDGNAPPPTIRKLLFKNGKIFENKKETGYYVAKTNKIRFRPGKIKILCYGTYIDNDHMEGEISYFPTSERFGTWKAERIQKKH